MKGRTKWFKTKDCYPVRVGWYECGVIITSMQRQAFSWMLYYDGHGFLCDIPMRVPLWRGMTKKAHKEATK
jgi:hypothetical protein